MTITVWTVSTEVDELKKRVAFLEGELQFIAGRAATGLYHDDGWRCEEVLREVLEVARAAWRQP